MSMDTLILLLNFILTLPHMGDFEQLHTWGGAQSVCSTNAKNMKFSEMMCQRKMRLHAKN